MPPTWLQSAGRILLTSIRACNEGYLKHGKILQSQSQYVEVKLGRQNNYH